jgi:hypothetical protein
MNRKPKYLKSTRIAKPNQNGQIELFDPWMSLAQQKNDKKVNQHKMKQLRKIDITAKKVKDSDSDLSSSGSDSDDDFKADIKPPPPRPPMMPKKEQPKFNGLDIVEIKSTKNETYQRPTMIKGIIPKHPSINMVIGSIGSGKTVFLCNTLLNEHMYGKDKTGRPYWDEIFVFTNSNDDILQKLIDDKVIPKNHVKHNPSEKHLKSVIRKQKEMVKNSNGDWAKVPRLFIILDDIIDCDIVKSDTFKSLCSRPRQINCSVFVLSQYYFSLPKICRQNATNIFCFSGNVQDKEALCDTFTPPSLTKKEFGDILGFCWSKDEKYSHPFIHISRKEPEQTRFRKCLLDVIDINSFKK